MNSKIKTELERKIEKRVKHLTDGGLTDGEFNRWLSGILTGLEMTGAITAEEYAVIYTDNER